MFDTVAGTRPIVPNSSPNTAQGSSKIGEFQSDGGTVDIYMNFIAAQNVSSFDLYNLYFACAGFDGQSIGPAQGCTLGVAGFSNDGRMYTSTFEYDPSARHEASMARAVFGYPGFRQIQSVSIGVIPESTPGEQAVVFVDSLEHIDYGTG